MALEVAEHLSPSRAEGFVEDLTRPAPVVLFSAAILNQGGVNHINEQWPSWWAKIFAKHGFKACDVVRSKTWDNNEVESWRRQNMIIYASEGVLSLNHSLRVTHQIPFDVVHPDTYRHMISPKNKTMLIKHLWWAVNNDWRKWRRSE